VLGRLSLSQVPAFGPHGVVLAPEVARGEVAARDPAAAEGIDLYGLGCSAIELACGHAPFADEDPQKELRGHADARPPRLTDLRGDLPTECSDLVEWLLAKQPGARPRSAADVLMQIDSMIDRLGSATRLTRILIVDDDTARARWLWGLARRAHPAIVVETASEGSDAVHKLNRDHPELVLVDAGLKGMMNALELCMYTRGLAHGARCELVAIGNVGPREQPAFDAARVAFIADDGKLANAVLDCVRATANAAPRRRTKSSTISG
jgi:CheY-like chemotaxis protein